MNIIIKVVFYNEVLWKIKVKGINYELEMEYFMNGKNLLLFLLFGLIYILYYNLKNLKVNLIIYIIFKNFLWILKVIEMLKMYIK